MIERATLFSRSRRREAVLRSWAAAETETCRAEVRRLDKRIGELRARGDERGHILADCLEVLKRRRLDLARRNLRFLSGVVDRLVAELS